jgi:DDE superfamily endonuclease
VVTVGEARPGHRNDIVVHRATTAATTLNHSRVIGDGAYRAASGITTAPPRRHDNRPPRVQRYFNRRRARAEHTIARLKDWQILRQHRRRGDAINETFRAVAAVYNLRLDNP